MHRFTLALLEGTAGIEAQGREKQQLGVPRVGKVQTRDRAGASDSSRVQGGLGDTKQGFIPGKNAGWAWEENERVESESDQNILYTYETI